LRLADLYGNEIMAMITVQYRMHQLRMDWSSQELYDSKIKAHTSVAAYTLYGFDGVQKTSSTESTLILIDIAGCDMEEEKDDEGITMNEGEMTVALAHEKRLAESGVDSSNIGIITSYTAQVGLSKIMRSNEMKVLNVTCTYRDPISQQKNSNLGK